MTARRASGLVGTFAYLPPERWRGEPPAVSGDMWAAGCVLYRLICGRPPRLLPDVADYVAAATRGEPVPDLRDITDAPGAHTAAGRPRRPDRAVAAIGGIALLLVVGLIAAWRLGGSPNGTHLAAGDSTKPAASHATATPAVTASAPRSGSAVSSPGHRAGSPATSRFASPAGSGSVSPSSSPRASSPATTAAGPTASATASSSPAEVPIPNVVGMSFPQAERLLQSDGFTVVGTHNPPGNSVVSTSPSGAAPAGSVITVVYGSGNGQDGQ